MARTIARLDLSSANKILSGQKWTCKPSQRVLYMDDAREGTQSEAQCFDPNDNMNSESSESLNLEYF
jgi:hypothetical protein